MTFARNYFQKFQKIHERAFPLLFLVTTVFALSSCAAPPTYVAPDPLKSPVARLRISTLIGLSTQVSIHPNNEINRCLKVEDKKTLPVEKNTSGFPQKSSFKKLGMPGPEAKAGWLESEVYIPANQDLTFSTWYGWFGAKGHYSCTLAFRFAPKEHHDYQIRFMAGDRCQIGVQSIEVLDEDPGTTTTKAVEVSPVIAHGTPSWKRFCQ